MNLYLNKIKEKKWVLAGLIIGLIIIIALVYKLNDKPEQIEKLPIKKISYDLSSIILAIKKNDYLFTTKDSGYGKLKVEIDEVLNNIQKPALETNTIPETGKKKDKNIVTINKLKSKTVNVRSFIYKNDDVATKIKMTSQFEQLGTSDNNGNLVIKVHEFMIVLSGEYKGLLFVKSTQDAERWSAWEIDKNTIKSITELVRKGVK